MSTGEAARAIGVERSTLARWARDGRVTPARRTVGGQYRWNLDDLERQVDELWQQRGEA
ncbi:MerR family transcriptional regulator [Prauserella muralis]|uniref:MerR family transcriptional regulator n=1 Tax=Prauserella muralis TaxID=588067 RepID=A0A2V4AN92_9PSEU|nr:MerR family transcriptional regulator [Prauserella muralis]